MIPEESKEPIECDVLYKFELDESFSVMSISRDGRTLLLSKKEELN